LQLQHSVDNGDLMIDSWCVCMCCRAMLGNPQPSSGAVRDVNSNAPEVENYEVLEFMV